MHRLSLIALAFFIGLPNIVSACMPRSPYDYLIRGAYLLVLFSAVIAFSLELFQLLIVRETVRRGLRLTAYGFALFLLVGLLLACILRYYEGNWQRSLPDTPAGEVTLRC